MSLQVLSNTAKFNSSVAPEKSFCGEIQNGAAWRNPNSSDKVSGKVKAGVFLSTLTGVAIAMAFTLKGKGYSLNPAGLFKISPKKWGLFNVHYKKEEKEVEKLVVRLAAGSVGGGLIGGAIFDKKEHMGAKYREAIIQLVGNIFTPLLCVSGGVRLFEHFEPRLLKSMPFLKGRWAKVPNLIASGLSLLVGIILGNKVGNTINEKAFKVKDNRKVKVADMSPHLDDLCLATSLVYPNSKIGGIITRFIPVALMVAGYSTGVAQEKPERCNHCLK